MLYVLYSAFETLIDKKNYNIVITYVKLNNYIKSINVIIDFSLIHISCILPISIYSTLGVIFEHFKNIYAMNDHQTKLFIVII
jgi:hypothetical protein